MPFLYICTQSCPAFYNPMDYSPPGSSVHGTFQARILEWVAMPSSKGSTWLRYGTHISCIPSPTLLYHLIHQGRSVCVCVCVCVCIIDMNRCNILIYIYTDRWASLVAQPVKNSPAMQETPVQFLGPEDPLERG